jgi:hypothetical protein
MKNSLWPPQRQEIAVAEVQGDKAKRMPCGHRLVGSINMAKNRFGQL